MCLKSIKKQPEILFLKPVFKSMIWGGHRLAEDFGYVIPSETTGECWAVSAHEHGDCTVADGKYKGRKLSELWKEEPGLFGGNTEGKFPLLIKIIDAKQDLSIQVHPDDEYAAKNENGSFGKTECWYVLDAVPGATIVIGHNAASKEDMCNMIDEKRWGDFIREIPVKKGDFFQIDPGTLHAIKGGTLILETQQNSDITYRVYDYDRLSNGKPRELHLEKSKAVITCPFTGTSQDSGKPSVLKFAGKGRLCRLVDSKYYSVYNLLVNGNATVSGKWPFLIASIVDGEGMLNGRKVLKGDHFIVPAGLSKISLSGNMQLIISHI